MNRSTNASLEPRRWHRNRDDDERSLPLLETPVVLSEMPTADPRVVWQARRSGDRGRLEVVARVTVGAEVVEVELPNARLLEAWLEGRHA